MSRKSWISFVDHGRLNQYPRHLRAVLLAVEESAEYDPYSDIANVQIARAAGCSVRTAQRHLHELEGRGDILIVMTDRGRPERLGIVLLRRLSVADKCRVCTTDAEIRAAAEFLRNKWALGRKDRASVRPVFRAPFGAAPEPAPICPTQTASNPQESPGKIDQQHDKMTRRSMTNCHAVACQNVTPLSIEFPEKESKQQQGKPLPPDSTDAQTGELSTDGAEAVARVRAEAEASKPTDAVPLAAAVEQMARAGHDPGRLEAIARESLRKDRPTPYFLAAVRNRAAEEDPQARLLRGVPKPPPKPKGQTVELTAEDIAFFASAKSGCGVGRKVGGVAR